MTPVTDPALLAQLNGGSSQGGLTQVADPEVLKQLEAAQPSSWMDALKSIPGAALKGLSNTLSLYGKIGQSDADLMSQAYTGQKVSDTGVPNPEEIPQRMDALVPTYQPQTQGGKIAAAAVTGATGAMTDPLSLVGPGGPVRALLSGGTAGALAGATGSALEGTPYALPASILAALLAPSFASKSGAVTGRLPQTAQELDNAATNGYRSMRTTPVDITNAGDWADRTLQYLQHPSVNMTERLNPETTNILEDMATKPGPMSPADLDEFKNLLSNVRGENATPTVRARLNDFAINDAQGNGDIDAFRQGWQQANGDFAAARRLEAVDAAANSAEVATAGTNSAKNLGNTYKARFRKFLTNDNEARGFQTPELDAIDAMNSGSPWVNAMRNFGNRFGGGGGVGQTALALGAAGLGGGSGYAGGGTEGAVLGGVGLPLAGILARGRYNAAVARQIGDIRNLVAARSPLAVSRGASFIPPAAGSSRLVKRLLNAALAARLQQ